MHSQRLFFRHALGALSFVLPYLLLNRPQVIFTSHIGFVAWYPAITLVMPLLSGVSHGIHSDLFRRCFCQEGCVRPASHALRGRSWERGKYLLLFHGGLPAAQVPSDCGVACPISQ